MDKEWVPSEEGPPHLVGNGRRLKAQAGFAQAVLRHLPMWCFAFDDDGELINFNRTALEELTQEQLQTLVNTPPIAHREALDKCRRTQRPQRIVWEWEPVSRTWEISYRFDVATDCVLAFGQEITQHTMERSNLRHQLLTSKLGLPNHAHFNEHVDKLVGAGRRYGLMLIDVDEFKKINDEHRSHSVGDRVLDEISARLQSACRERDFVAHFHGDEFAVAVALSNRLNDEQVREKLRIVAERLMKAVRRPMKVEGMSTDWNVTVSIGIAYTTARDRTRKTLLSHADQAAYAAKDAGRDRYVFFKPEMKKKLSQEQKQNPA
jgi:diguanylate cyclase (GGDEF)-like protein